MTAAQRMSRLALAWLALDLTGSVGQFGLIVFLQGIPMLVLSLYGGVLADRYDRRALLVICQSVICLSLALLGLLTVTGDVAIWHLYVVSLMLGGAQSLSMPARTSLIPGLVAPDEVVGAVTLNSMQQLSSVLVWPFVAGLLISTVGVGVTLLVAAALQAQAILCLIGVRVGAIRRASHGSPVAEMVEGMRYAFTNPLIRMTMAITLGIGLLGFPILSLAPGFAREEMGLSAQDTGLFVLVGGIGSVLGSLRLLVFPVQNRVGLFILSCLGFAVGLLLMSLSPWLGAAFFFNAFIGFWDSQCVISGQTVFQMEVPAHLLGRVMSLWSVSIGLSSLGSLPISLVGDEVGLRWSLGASAVLLMLVIAWFAIIDARMARRLPVTERAAQS